MSSLTSGAVPSAPMDASPAEAAIAAPVTPAVTGETAEYDPLRDGPLRYLGYANEVRRLLHSVVRTRYGCTLTCKVVPLRGGIVALRWTTQHRLM